MSLLRLSSPNRWRAAALERAQRWGLGIGVYLLAAYVLIVLVTALIGTAPSDALDGLTFPPGLMQQAP